METRWQIIQGDALAILPTMEAGSVHCCVTSPPYWGLRDYGVEGQIGLESTPEQYIARMVEVFAGVRRVLRDDGTLWLNLGDSYNAYNGNRGASTSFQSATEEACPALPGGHGLTAKGLKPKDLVGIPWRVALALQADGWYLRSDIIWSKPNPMPESVTDRPTKAHEYLFLLSKRDRYFYDAEAIKEPASMAMSSHDLNGSTITGGAYGRSVLGEAIPVKDQCGNFRNRRTVWEIATSPYPEAHFATFPEKLVEPCVKAGCPEGGTVLDPFNGSGTTGAVACKLGRKYVGIELNPDYIAMTGRRIGAALNPNTFCDQTREGDSPLWNTAEK